MTPKLRLLSLSFPPRQEVLLALTAATPVWLKKKLNQKIRAGLRPLNTQLSSEWNWSRRLQKPHLGEEASWQSRCGLQGSGAAGGADEDRWGGGRRTGDRQQSPSLLLTAENEGRDTHVHTYLSL